MKNLKVKTEKTILTKREFSYKRDNCSLSFTLKIDDPRDATLFLGLLNEAKSDLEQFLNEGK